MTLRNLRAKLNEVLDSYGRGEEDRVVTSGDLRDIALALNGVLWLADAEIANAENRP
jgi:hypothetical protein